MTVYSSESCTFSSQNPEPELKTETESKPEMDETKPEVKGSKKFVKDLKIIWGDLSDFTLVCGGQDISCHSIVLARSSGIHSAFVSKNIAKVNFESR